MRKLIKVCNKSFYSMLKFIIFYRKSMTFFCLMTFYKFFKT